MSPRVRPGLAAAWAVAVAAAVGVRVWNALGGGLLWGYDAWGHVAYVLFVDLYGGIPWPDQGWSYFHPPLHYLLAQAFVPFGSAEALVRGLSLWGGAASLGTAGIAAWLVRRTRPERPGDALFAFCLVAFVPVHIHVSDMPGNEMTHTLLATAAVAILATNELRERPRLAADAAAGLVAGLCLLTKFSGLLPLAALVAALLVRPLLPGERRALRRALGRAGVLVAAAALVAGPFYLRNLSEYGQPFQKSNSFPLVGDIERAQPPGFRRATDFLSFPPELFRDPNPLAPHLLHSVWGTAYASTWADVYRESDSSRALEAELVQRRSSTLLLLLGLVPTALGLLGAGAATRDLWRGRERAVGLPLWMLAAGTLGAFALYAWALPRWPALKAAYLLPMSLSGAWFGVRGLEALRGRGALPGAAAALSALAFAAAAVVGADGVVLPRRADSPAAAAAQTYFGDHDAARRIYDRLIATSRHPIAWWDNRAAVEIASGRPERAQGLYARASAEARRLGLADPRRRGRLAVAQALVGEREAAERELDAALARAREPLADLRANRGALRARRGDLEGAMRDLHAALAEAPEMTPAWLNLARVLAAASRPDEAEAARRRAAATACTPPRGYPFGLGTGETLDWGVGRRPLLLLEDDGLRVAGVPFYRDACRRLRG